MILLWQVGIIDSLTLLQFCINCGAQCTGLTLSEVTGYMSDISTGVLLASVKGLGTGYQYLQAAHEAMKKRARATTLSSFMAVSSRVTLTDSAINAAADSVIPSFIGHMKSLIEKIKNNGMESLVLANSAILSKYTND